jgi:hypothetical protein
MGDVGSDKDNRQDRQMQLTTCPLFCHSKSEMGKCFMLLTNDLDPFLLVKCMKHLTLLDFTSCTLVSQAWRGCCTIAFAAQLRWRGSVCFSQVDLPPTEDTNPPDTGQNQACIARCSGMATFVSPDDASVVALVADPTHQSVRTFRCLGAAGAEVAVEEEHPRREWRYSTICGGFPGSLVGYNNEGAMAYFPALATSGISNVVREAPGGDYMNILQCGDQLFLLRNCSNWWNDRSIIADVLNISTGGWLRMEIAPFRDKLRSLLTACEDGEHITPGGVHIESQAVSATDSHFVYRVYTSVGTVVGSLLLPDASNGNTVRARAERVDVIESGLLASGCVQRFSPSHPLSLQSEGRHCNEAHVGDDLLLYGEWSGKVGPQRANSGLVLCVLNSFTGVCRSVRLRPPPPPPPPCTNNVVSSVTALASLTVCAAGSSGVASAIACGCTQQVSVAAPHVLLWDLETGMHLALIMVRSLMDPASQDWSRRASMDLAVNVHRRIQCAHAAGSSPGECVGANTRSSGVIPAYCQVSILLSMWDREKPGGKLLLFNILDGNNGN